MIKNRSIFFYLCILYRLYLTEKSVCCAQFLEINSKKDPLDNEITHFQHHPSITAIGQNKSDETFDFPLFAADIVSWEIRKLESKSSSLKAKLFYRLFYLFRSASLKHYIDTCAPYTYKHIQLFQCKRNIPI